ncbi:serine/threonine-protein kinase 10-A-like [Sycon ciliatum]|uniref:serine/threonine-protein kinase 10-A-like n=1 Tax=Sycon ciliatum TaxID=27933 RepID=UPI0031F6B036
MEPSWPSAFPTDYFGPVLDYDADKGQLAHKIDIDKDIPLEQGSYGAVYTAKVPGIQSRVIVKVVGYDASIVDYDQQVLWELSVGMDLLHKNIVTCYGGLQAPGIPMIFYELMHGRNLWLLLCDTMRLQQPGIPEVRLQPIIMQVLEALHYLQTAKIVHGDLKANNVLVGRRTGRTKLCDFGMSEDVTRSKCKKLVRRPYCHPPELAVADMGGYDHKLDIFFLGSMVYRTATGVGPYGFINNMTSQQAIEKVAQKPFLNQESYQRLSPSLQSFIRSLLKYCPTDRPHAAAALEHPWITEAPQYEPPTLCTHKVADTRKMLYPKAYPTCMCKLDHAVLRDVASQLHTNSACLGYKILSKKNCWYTIPYRARMRSMMLPLPSKTPRQSTVSQLSRPSLPSQPPTPPPRPAHTLGFLH